MIDNAELGELLIFVICALQPTYEDSMDLIAKLPVVGATIYNNLFRDGATPCPIDLDKDWSHNFTEMIDYKDPMFIELMRLYLTIHRQEIWCRTRRLSITIYDACFLHYST